MKTFTWLNYDKLMAADPFVYLSNVNGAYDLVEHPSLGEMADVIVVSHKYRKAWYSGFFDPFTDEGDMADIFDDYITIVRELEGNK